MLVFSRGIERNKINQENFLENLRKSAAIEEERMPLFEAGIKSFIAKDYVSALHILIPQIEAACRFIYETCGGNSWQQSKDGKGFHVKTLDTLLRDEFMKSVLPEDFILYFRVLFTDQRGWNLRNDLSHGLLELPQFSEQTAAQVMHALTLLSVLRIKQDKV